MQLQRSSEVLAKVSELGCQLLGCEEVYLWVVHSGRQILWRYDPASQDTIHVPLPGSAVRRSLRKSMDGAGLLTAALLSREEISCANPVDDPRCDELDRRIARARASTGSGGTFRGEDRYGARLLVPMRADGAKMAHAIVEARGKSGGFNCDDKYILRALANVALEVLRVCEMTDEQDWEEKRTEYVMKLAQNLMATQVHDSVGAHDLAVLKRGLKALFNADEVALHLVYPKMLGRLDLVGSEERVHEVPMLGLLAACVKQKKPISSVPDERGAKYNPEVDLPWPDGVPAHLHTVPAFWNKAVSSVLQFRCTDPAGRPFGDDGSFNPYSSHHLKLLNQLLVYIMLRVNERYPMMDRDLGIVAPIRRDSARHPAGSGKPSTPLTAEPSPALPEGGRAASPGRAATTDSDSRAVTTTDSRTEPSSGFENRESGGQRGQRTRTRGEFDRARARVFTGQFVEEFPVEP